MLAGFDRECKLTPSVDGTFKNDLVAVLYADAEITLIRIKVAHRLA